MRLHIIPITGHVHPSSDELVQLFERGRAPLANDDCARELGLTTHTRGASPIDALAAPITSCVFEHLGRFAQLSREIVEGKVRLF